MNKTMKILSCVAMVAMLLLTLTLSCFASSEESYPVEFSMEGYAQESIDRLYQAGVSVSLKGVYCTDGEGSSTGSDYPQKSSVVTIQPISGKDVTSGNAILSFSFQSYYYYSGDVNDVQSFGVTKYVGADGVLYRYDQLDGEGNYGYVPTGNKADFLRCDSAETAEKLRALLNPTQMSDLVVNIFESFGLVIGGLTEGLKNSFEELIYVDASVAEPEFSPLILFLFTLAGVAVATDLVYSVFAMIKGHRRG